MKVFLCTLTLIATASAGLLPNAGVSSGTYTLGGVDQTAYSLNGYTGLNAGGLVYNTASAVNNPAALQTLEYPGQTQLVGDLDTRQLLARALQIICPTQQGEGLNNVQYVQAPQQELNSVQYVQAQQPQELNSVQYVQAQQPELNNVQYVQAQQPELNNVQYVQAHQQQEINGVQYQPVYEQTGGDYNTIQFVNQALASQGYQVVQSAAVPATAAVAAAPESEVRYIQLVGQQQQQHQQVAEVTANPEVQNYLQLLQGQGESQQYQTVQILREEPQYRTVQLLQGQQPQLNGYQFISEPSGQVQVEGVHGELKIQNDESGGQTVRLVKEGDHQHDGGLQKVFQIIHSK